MTPLSTAPTGTLPLVSGYTLTEPLYDGSRTVVYRALSAAQKPVVIKLLQNAYPTFNELAQFRNQYAITKDLPIPGIVRPLTLESWQNGYALVMEDFGGISLQQFVQQHPLTIGETLGVAAQIAAVLSDLGQHQVVHKDIKPANILIHPDSKRVKLIDFSIASLLPKEIKANQHPHGLEGTLAYIAPEQTGRMNRGIDYRTDFYSFGITLYELLTGELPFLSKDPLELVHCHIAQTPTAPHQINPDIPVAVSQIVLKLMAKNAEDRYQSALGLQYDLEKCLIEWKETGGVNAFDLGQRDVSDRFLIPEKLYGRETEVQTLLDAFDRTSKGRAEWLLVAGFSGIGKTAVVSEVHKPITHQHGYFSQGKFDQFNRDLPFSAFVQALKGLMGQLLSEPDEKLAQWRSQILNAVGDDGQVLVDVLPALEQVIGPQPTVIELSGTAAQHRFNRLFQAFIAVFATAAHPLVIFLDDLQWADSASLQLIELLMLDSKHLLLLGAYRDNEVSAAHPLLLTTEALTKAGATVNTITLAALAFDDTNRLVADTLNCSTETAYPLTALVDQKTQGNPFFITQFLKALHDEGHITFNLDLCAWECDIAHVTTLSLTDDVVLFMTQQLQKLTDETQSAIQLAACMGNQFELETLAITLAQSPTETAAALWQALEKGLILPMNEVYKFYTAASTIAGVNGSSNNSENQGDSPGNQGHSTYRFLHDRVQQAAYALVADEYKPAVHLRIGQLCRQQIDIQSNNNQIFAVVNHLNKGMHLIDNPTERADLLQLNALAGRRASASTAYQAAFSYLQTAQQLLPAQSWQQDYALTHQIYIDGINTAYLAGEMAQMEVLYEEAIEQTHSLLDRVPLYEIKIQALVSQHRLPETVQLGLETLQKLGVQLPENPMPEDFGQGLKAITEQLAGRSVATLIDLPEMQDPCDRASMRVLLRLSAIFMMAAPHLMPFVIFKMVSLSIQQGNTPISALAYATYGMILSSAVDDIETGYAFGQLALQVVEKLPSKQVQAKTLARFYAGVDHFKASLRSALKPLANTYQIALANGDLEYAAISAQVYSYTTYFSGQSLSQINPEIAAYRQGIAEVRQTSFLYCTQIFQQHILNLLEDPSLNDTENPCELRGPVYNETIDFPKQVAAQDAHGIALFHLFKAIGYALFDAPDQALEHLNEITSVHRAIAPFQTGCEVYYYDSLVRLTSFDTFTAEEQSLELAKVERNQQKLNLWATHAPMNYQHKFQLVEAERARVLGNKLEALDYYDQAIASARSYGYQQDAAKANELAAQFYLAWEKNNIAAVYMQAAYYGYARWEAKAKTHQLEQTYPDLLTPILQKSVPALNLLDTSATIVAPSLSSHTVTNVSGSTTSLNDSLDFSAVLRSSQVLSGTIDLDELLRQLTRMILQNSGGDRCALFLPNHVGKWHVQAITTQETTILCSDPLDYNPNVPVQLIQYVKNTQKNVIVNDLKTDLPVIDGYLQAQQPKSLLCLPLLNQSTVIGILYLSNQVTSGVFTENRLQVLHFLCTQAAISLENSRLYQREQEKTKQLQLSESNLKNLYENAADPILLLGEQTFSNCNQAAVDLFEATDISDLCGLSPAMLSPEFQADGQLSRDKARAIIQQGLQNGKKRFEWQYQTLKGKVFWAEVVLTPLRYQGTVVMHSIVRDISDRKAAEAKALKKSQELEQALSQLQQSQSQVIQSEKMSALGNLVAGVAHEINNPIGFLNGSIKNAQNYVEDLQSQLELYQQHYPNPVEPIQDNAEEIDLDFVCEDLPKLLNSMKGATDRIKSISTSLRTFSRADTEHKVSGNLHEGLDSTLLILKYRLKADENRPAIEIIQDYGDLPAIDCFPGRLNQVFMNLLANAIDVFDEAAQQSTFAELKDKPQTITVKTAVLTEKKAIEISIRDNGKGMEESVRCRIFDHLFTTKGVGKGTGLGLAIAQQIIVDAHGGTIDVKSQPGEGTEFCIQLPF